MSEVHDLSIAFRVLFVILGVENHLKENCYVSKSTLSTLYKYVSIPLRQKYHFFPYL